MHWQRITNYELTMVLAISNQTVRQFIFISFSIKGLQTCSQLYQGLTHQHGRSEIKLLLKLCDKDMHTDQSIRVIFLYLSDNVSEPFKMFLRPGDPQKIHLKIAILSLWTANSKDTRRMLDNIKNEYKPHHQCLFCFS